MRRLPPLNALRAFEAAAARTSFSQAAADLHVTQAAVSHQVKLLEDWFGLPLFRREARSVRLTAAGALLFEAARDALETLAEVTRRLRDDDGGRLTVTVLHSFAATWLVPRLRRFREHHPDIDVRLDTTETLVDLARSDVDVAIRYGMGNWPGLHVEWLMAENRFPVCSPALAAGPPRLERLEDLRGLTLIHDDDIFGWPEWLAAAGIQGVDVRRGPAYNNSNLAVDAAINGDGILLARSVLVADALAAGRLVKPFDVSQPAHMAYYFACTEAALERPKVAAFRAWLTDEIDHGAGTGASAD
jgi:LysR family glycine cleavage system transcriptional activator